MKNLLKVLTLFLFLSQMVAAQSTRSIVDSKYHGIKVYSGTGYSGSATELDPIDGRVVTFPNGIGSVKIYGAWKLVNQDNGLVISQDDSHYNGNGGGTWIVEETSDKYFGIAYTGNNFSGEATYLKLNKTESFYAPIKSLKLIRPARIGWASATGYQRRYLAGEHPRLPKELGRIDINMKYAKPKVAAN